MTTTSMPGTSAARGELRSVNPYNGETLKIYGDRGEELLRPQVIPSRLADGVLVNEPLGVLFGIEPWNYPCYQVVRFAAPNLMAGSVIIL
jgi:succinate-semialdehyde dehydrogenase/glutarate-semialdehyde dehydrogenase